METLLGAETAFNSAEHGGVHCSFGIQEKLQSDFCFVRYERNKFVHRYVRNKCLTNVVTRTRSFFSQQTRTGLVRVGRARRVAVRSESVEKREKKQKKKKRTARESSQVKHIGLLFCVLHIDRIII